jgi:hypothetical protein
LPHHFFVIIKSWIVKSRGFISLCCYLDALKSLTEDGKKIKRKIPFTDKDREELQVNLHRLSLLDTWSESIFYTVLLDAIRCFFFLQSRIVVVENLPEDHSHQNVQKIFSVVGRSSLWVGRQHFCFYYSRKHQVYDCVLTTAIVNSVKTIRICHPHESNSSGAKNDFFVTNKVLNMNWHIFFANQDSVKRKIFMIPFPFIFSSCTHLWNLKPEK